MSQFLEVLENRALLSASVDTLHAGQATLNSAEAALKSATKELFVINQRNGLPIFANLKGVDPSVNKPLLAAFKSDVAIGKASVTESVNALIEEARSSTAKSVAAGKALLHKSTTASETRVVVDISLLKSAVSVILGHVQEEVSSQTVSDAVEALVTANPDDGALPGLVSTRVTEATAQKATISADANQIQTDLTALATNLGQIT